VAPTQHYALRIGGVTLSLESADEALALAVPARAGLFLAEDDPDLILRVAWRQLDDQEPGRMVFDSGGVWRLYEEHSSTIYRVFDERLGPAPYKEARLAKDGRTGDIFLDPRFLARGEPADAIEYPLDELLFMRLLAAKGGCELHACGVEAPSGQGLLFAGQSGDGKSTIARLWGELPGATVLSDDRIILRRADDGTWRIHGTPWHGDALYAAAASAPLRAVFLLAHGERNSLQPLAPAQAVSALLARTFTTFHDSATVAGIVALLADLAQDIPCMRFAFVPGLDPVRFALEGTRSPTPDPIGK
jgi:hypothetical protein